MHKLIVDFLPLLVFFAAYKWKDLFWATGAFMLASIALIAWTRLSGRKVEMMQWVTLALVMLFGGLTLWLQDENFIKWKPTIMYWLFAVILLGAWLIRKVNLIERLMSGQLELDALTWRTLLVMWVVFFAGLGVLNLYIAFRYPTETWVTFKVWWAIGLTLAFVVIQGIYVSSRGKIS